MNAVLARLGFATHPIEDYRYFVGDGMDCLVRRTLPKDCIDEQTIDKCLKAAKDEYGKHWAETTKPYPGIPELLDALENRSFPKVVLSNKPDDFTKLTVKKLLPQWSFQIIRGAGPCIPKKPDPTAALQIADELQIPPHKFIYLGDSNTDMLTANSAGMYAVGALWGFRTEQELLASGAKALVEKPPDVLKLLDSSKKPH
jgi:phosphoglycolate phosphatase